MSNRVCPIADDNVAVHVKPCARSSRHAAGHDRCEPRRRNQSRRSWRYSREKHEGEDGVAAKKRKMVDTSYIHRDPSSGVSVSSSTLVHICTCTSERPAHKRTVAGPISPSKAPLHTPPPTRCLATPPLPGRLPPSGVPSQQRDKQAARRGSLWACQRVRVHPHTAGA